MLQPSIHPLIADYEAAQDDAGGYFAVVGLRRGDRTAAARRAAREAGLPLPPRPRHTSPAEWRAEQTRKSRDALIALARDAGARDARAAEREAALAAREARAAAREAQLAAREASADAVLAVAEAVATGAIEIEPDTGAVVSKRPQSQDLAKRARQDPAAARRALESFRGAYARLAAAARQEALCAARAVFADLVALRDRLVAALPAAMRRAFQAESRDALRTATRALEKLGDAAAAGAQASPRTGESDER